MSLVVDRPGKAMAAMFIAVFLQASAACAPPTEAKQETAVQEAMELKIRQAQDRAAAISDEAAALDSRPLKPFLGYADLPSGPALTADQMLGMVQALAGGLRTADDFEPASVEKLLGLKLPPDSRNERLGVAGRMGEGGYSWAVWDVFSDRPGQFIQLKISTDACLSYPALKARMEAEGFVAYVPPFDDDPRITFDRRVAPPLSLYVGVMVDSLQSLACVSSVDFKLGRSNG